MMRAMAVALLAAHAAAAAPCDIYATAGTPCVAAHSMTRRLYDAYAGPLYRLRREGVAYEEDVWVLPGAGVADAAAHDAFCMGDASCVVSRIYDQSPQGNHLDPAPGMVLRSREERLPTPRIVPSRPVNASRYATTLRGRKVYGAAFQGGMGYRNDSATGTASGNDAETIYMVVDGRVHNALCCFDYGNAERRPRVDGAATMEAVYFGVQVQTPFAAPGVMADLELGLYAGRTLLAPATPLKGDFVTALLTGRNNSFALKGAAAPAAALTTFYDGARPYGYQPMRKEGAIILGIGGDNSHWDVGVWFEGVMTRGAASSAADDAVQADIAAAGYGE